MDLATSEKDTWISGKIKKLLADGTATDEKQAYAIALSMWEKMQSKMARMPILPSKPSKTVDGRNIPQELIDAVLSYDPTIRPAVLKLNSKDAHGDENSPSLATFDRTYVDGDFIYADLTPSTGYEQILPLLAGKNGPYSGRSIEVDKLQIGGEERLWLEAVGLCGAQRPAVNLPPAEFSKQSKQFYFTVNLTGGEGMPEEIKVDQEAAKGEPIDLIKFKADLEADFNKRFAEKEAEFAKREEAIVSEKMKTELKLAKEKLIQWVNSRGILTKVRADQRDNCVEIAMALKLINRKIQFNKKEMDLGDAFTSFVESMHDFISPKEIGDYLPKDIQVEEKLPDDSNERQIFLLKKINQYAKTKGVDLRNPEEFRKAEEAVTREFAGVK